MCLREETANHYHLLFEVVFILSYMYRCFTYVYARGLHVCMSCAQRGLNERASDPPELELLVVVRHRVGSRSSGRTVSALTG